ncbi:hypothetical protein [Agromyces sp. S2-1-8]|uniref:hypothetical protein n=1 Tax=Agromyces sp. S2-1-8 TaxID=2897180 RepID=UPI001E4EAEBE|nr:hypothetical protein [Agromyces sp. S2-1-8]MCD5348395.1 hypothetical protein [Agromyces sp. S2-1-8]
MSLLKEMGEYVKGPSSSIQPPVARRLSAALQAAGHPKVDRRPAMQLPRVTAEAAAGLVGQLPHAMPEFLALLLDGLQRTEPRAGDAISAATKHRYFAMFRRHPEQASPSAELDLPRPSGVALFLTEEAPWSGRLLAWSHTSDQTVTSMRLGLIVADHGRGAKLRITNHEEEQTGAVNGSLRGPRARRSALSDDIRAVCRRDYELGERERIREREIDAAERRRPSSGRTRPDVNVVYVSARAEHGPGEKSASANPREVQWTVQGHWRRQWYPTNQEHRPIWISEHRAGRVDAPLIVRDRVYVYGAS